MMLVIITSYHTTGACARAAPRPRTELDGICCPVIRHKRKRMLGNVWNPNSRLQRVAYLYQSSTYKQYLEETDCRFPYETVPTEIQQRDSRCNGRCEQQKEGQLMITIEPPPLNFSLTYIEVKTACDFVPMVHDTN